MKNFKNNSYAAHLWIPILLSVNLAFVSCVKIETFLPPGGQPGDEIEIIGSGFSGKIKENLVKFGKKEAEIFYASEETLRVRVPEGVVRSKIKVSRRWFNSNKSQIDFLLLPDYLQYRKFDSPTLGITQGYWIVYPPSFEVEGNRFPIIYTLHGNNGRIDKIFKKFGLPGFWQKNEHQLIFEIAGAGMYFPFIAYSLMKSSSIAEFGEVLQTQLTVVAGEVEKNHVNEVVESIIYYLPENPDSWLPNLTEMIMVFPDGDNSWYMNRLGPPEGRNEEGLGAESSFPTSDADSPAGRLAPHVTGWYEQYIINDVIREIEEHVIGIDKLAVINKRIQRFIMGVSMGGGGSFTLSLRNPAKFVALAGLGLGFSTTSEQISPRSVYIKNLIFPELIDVYGSAPLPVDASQEEVVANVHLDSAYISAHNPWDIIASLDQTDLHFFVEVGENDIMDKLNPGTIMRVQEFIDWLREKGMPVTGGIVPAASEGEPDNGNANHLQGFFRSRLGAVLKFFSDVYSLKKDVDTVNKRGKN